MVNVAEAVWVADLVVVEETDGEGVNAAFVDSITSVGLAGEAVI
jgi:hypothetical protein